MKQPDIPVPAARAAPKKEEEESAAQHEKEKGGQESAEGAQERAEETSASERHEAGINIVHVCDCHHLLNNARTSWPPQRLINSFHSASRHQ